MKSKLLAYLQLALAMILVGSSVVVGKILTVSVPVFLASGMSLLVALFILLPLMLRENNGIPKLKTGDLRMMFLQALLGTFLYRIFLLYGLRYTGAIESGIITSTEPAVVAILSLIFLKEKLGLNKILGITLSVGGIMVMNLIGNQNGFAITNMALIGSILVFGSVIGEAMFTILAKPVSKTITPLITSTMVTLFGFLMFLPFGLYEMSNFNIFQMSIIEIATTAYYGVFVTAIAFMLWFNGLKKVEASVAGMFTGFIPVSAVLLSYLILGEEVGTSHILGGFLILLSILIITGFPSKKLRSNI